MRSDLNLHHFGTPEMLHDALADRIAEAIENAVADRGHALIALSGGNTPKPLFTRLSAMELPWEKVTVTLVDERWVAPDAPDSNERLVRGTLMQGPAAAATFVPLKNDASTAAEGIAACNAALAHLPMPFDVVLLGMGSDGHTASFFPYAETLDAALTGPERCAAVTPKHAPHERMTLTLPTLLETGLLVLHIEGREKYDVLQMALRDESVHDMPVRSVLFQGRTPLHIYYTKE